MEKKTQNGLEPTALHVALHVTSTCIIEYNEEGAL